MMDNTLTISLKCIVGKKLLYIVFIVFFFFPESFRLFQNKNIYLKKRLEFFSLLHNCGKMRRAVWQHNQITVSERSLWLIQEVYLFALQYSLAGSQFPDQGSNPCPPAVSVQSFNHWTTKEVPEEYLLSGKVDGL